MCVSIRFTENGRVLLAIVITTINTIVAISGLYVIGMAIYLKIHIDNRLMLLESYDPGMLTHFLVSIGLLLIFLNGLGAKIASDCSSIFTRDNFLGFLLSFVVLMFCFCWVVFAGGIVLFTHGSTVEEALHSGILAAMKRYKTEVETKTTIDKLQMKIKCCGSRSFRDWFKTSWINTKYLDTTQPGISSKMKGDNFFGDYVPFSCCDYRARRPCVHHKVEDKTAHTMYDEVTLYNRGCTTAMIDHFENDLLHPSANVVMIIFGVELLNVILMRYLQTSIWKAYDLGNPTAVSLGYVFPPAFPTRSSGALESGAGGGGGFGDFDGGDDGGNDDAGGGDDGGGDDGGGDGGGGDGGGGGGKDKEKKDKKKKDKDKKKDQKKKDKKDKGKKKSKDKSKKGGKSPKKSPKRKGPGKMRKRSPKGKMGGRSRKMGRGRKMGRVGRGRKMGRAGRSRKMGRMGRRGGGRRMGGGRRRGGGGRRIGGGRRRR